MESVHCYRCYRFPSKDLDFYITNCMHIFCVECKHLCQPPHPASDPKCIECKLQPIRILKMGPTMPHQVKQMFTPIREDITQSTKDLTRVITFQQRQRQNLMNGMTKKLRFFDRLRDAHTEEKSKKENYKKQLEHAYRIIQSKESEIMDLKQKQFDLNRAAKKQHHKQAPPPSPVISKSTKCSAETMTTPSMIRVFSDSMYQTPRQKKERNEKKKEEKERVREIPPFMRTKSQTAQPATKERTQAPLPEQSSFKTPQQPPRTSMGFTTPANPPHMFPHLKKFEAAVKSSRQHSQ